MEESRCEEVSIARDVELKRRLSKSLVIGLWGDVGEEAVRDSATESQSVDGESNLGENG